MKTTQNVYFVGIHKYSYKAGEPALVLGVKSVQKEDGTEEICYHLKYEDDCEDYSPICDNNNYKLISEQEKIKELIPEVIY